MMQEYLQNYFQPILLKAISGRCNKFSARLAPLDFFDRFLNFTLFEAIMPVSEPDEKPEKNNKSINTIININEESINYESLLRIVIVRTVSYAHLRAHET